MTKVCYWDDEAGEQRERDMTPEEEAQRAADIAAAALPKIPASVTMRQARLALLAAGKLDAVNTAIAAMASPQKEAAQIQWEYSSDVFRNWPLVLSLGPALGLSSTDLDNLFIQAAML